MERGPGGQPGAGADGRGLPSRGTPVGDAHGGTEERGKWPLAVRCAPRKKEKEECSGGGLCLSGQFAGLGFDGSGKIFCTGGIFGNRSDEDASCDDGFYVGCEGFCLCAV